MTHKNAMKRWLSQATPKETARLAELSRTSVNHLRQIAGAYRTGGVPTVEADLAGRIERASMRIKRVPPIYRTELCPACGACQYAKSCLTK